MYLWTFVFGNVKTKFEFTEHTAEKERESITGYFKTDRIYFEDEPSIKQLIEETSQLSKILNLDLKNDYVLIRRGFKELDFIYKCGMFDARLREGSVVIRTENGWTYTREQMNAIFDFVDKLKEMNLFF